MFSDSSVLIFYCVHALCIPIILKKFKSSESKGCVQVSDTNSSFIPWLSWGGGESLGDKPTTWALFPLPPREPAG